MRFPGGDPGRARILPSEDDAYKALLRAQAIGRMELSIDPRPLNIVQSPVYNALEIFVPPIVLWTSSITLLLSFGMFAWVVTAVVLLVWQVYGAHRLVLWRVRRRAERLAIASLAGFKALWALGGVLLVCKDPLARSCVAPAGDWRLFVADTVMEPDEAIPVAPR